LIRRRIGHFCRYETISEAKLHSANADGVPAPPLKHGVVGIQGMYSASKVSNSEDVTDSDQEKADVKHDQVSKTQRGSRMVFGTTLDRLATRNTAGK
jgi:hypothetical protein